MPANPQGFDHFRRGEPFTGALSVDTSSFNYYRRSETLKASAYKFTELIRSPVVRIGLPTRRGLLFTRYVPTYGHSHTQASKPGTIRTNRGSMVISQVPSPGASQIVSLKTVTAANSALAFGRAKTLAIVTELDSVLAIVRAAGGGHVLTLATVLETDAALAFGRMRRLITVTETDAALTLGKTKQRALAAVLETDTALALGKAKQRALTTVLETDLALAFGKTKQRALAVVTESDAALALGKTKQKALSTVLETDLALAVGKTKQRALATVTGTNTALPFGRAKRLITVTELDAALGITRAGVIASARKLRTLMGMGT